MARKLHVVTHRNWIADEFKRFGGIQDFGFDVSEESAANDLWWASTYWVGQAKSAGVNIPLLSCGPRWLYTLPKKWTQRKVFVGAPVDVRAFVLEEKLPKIHVKLPELKLDNFPAAVMTVAELEHVLDNSPVISDGTLIQVSEVINLRSEARFFIAHGKVHALSWYRLAGKTFDSDDFTESLESSMFADLVDKEMREMYALAVDVAANADAPPGYVLDVGVLNKHGRVPVVVEANAAWSSSPYGADIYGVMEAVEAAHDFEGVHQKWAFNPNQANLKYPPLKVVQ